MLQLKKYLCLLLVATMLLCPLAVLTGCGQNTETPDDTSKQSGTANETEEEEDNRFVGIDYKDRPFRVYTSTAELDSGSSSSNFLIEGTAKTEGNRVNDAVLERNVLVEELLGVKLEFTQTDIGIDGVSADIRRLTQSGFDDYDLVINTIYAFSELLIEGNFRNILDEECVFDFERNYWYKDYMDDLRLMDGYQYVLAGDYFIDILRSAHLLLVNKDLYQNYYNRSANELYDLVSNYEWTFDKLNSVCTGLYADLNTNNEVDDGDQFGFMTASYWGGAIPFMISGNPTYISRDEDGIPTVTIQEGERANLLAAEMSKIFNNDSANIGLSEVKDLLLSYTQNECLVLGYQRLGSLENAILRSMEGDSAVLPYPMLFASDKKYTTSTHDTTYMAHALCGLRRCQRKIAGILTSADNGINSHISHNASKPSSLEPCRGQIAGIDTVRYSVCRCSRRARYGKPTHDASKIEVGVRPSIRHRYIACVTARVNVGTRVMQQMKSSYDTACSSACCDQDLALVDTIGYPYLTS